MTTSATSCALLDGMPERIAERVHPLNGHRSRGDGEFVLYWTHHAMRGHENPALDAALLVGARLRKPVLVYQGLGGRHPYNSDRHHTFILEGARDLAAELAARDIAYAFHLARDPRRPGPLAGLARRAAAIVTEDFPVPPFRDWYERWARVVTVPFWAVDTACLVPVRSIGRRYERAFEFRTAVRSELDERVSRPWPEIDSDLPPCSTQLGFDPLDLESVSIPDACAACRIDHGIGPVAHTRGGSRAGYERWSRFRDHGLAEYHRFRNDAAVDPPRGVSRMSAYLHYGQVSPFRIAREAAAAGGDGARKFLDELLVWRELAQNACAHTRDVESLDALPAWARETLVRHADDARDVPVDRDRLSRGRTGDELWDLAQRSLLIHGELHNNVRMTWGKAIVGWTRSPDEALETLIDLNHRYALDGNDPNSYGGLLWCLGLFDRPFEPERPVLGTVRPRSTDAHRARLDLARYRGRIERPASGAARRIAVVGGGPAGLAAARTLSDHGHSVTVFDKGRGVGGRTSVRRAGGASFDFGAPSFTVRDPRFGRLVGALAEAATVAAWDDPPRHPRGRPDEGTGPGARFVGVPGMNALALHLADDLDARGRCRVTHLERDGGFWTIRVEGAGEKTAGGFDDVVVALPAPQAALLLDGSGLEAVARRCADVSFDPCWAVMALFDEPVGAPFDLLEPSDEPLAWLSREASKPGRPGEEAWVVHASARWSVAHLEDEPERVGRSLLEAFAAAVGRTVPAPTHLDAHRWRFARCATPLDDGCLHDPDACLTVCGDWCLGSDVEAAVLSGLAAAGRILGRLGAAADGASS